jgi:hypothetical protein
VFKIGPQEVTLADLFHLPYATMLSVAGTDIMTTKGPNVTRFVSDFPRGSTKLLNPLDGSTISRRARPGLQSRITLKVFPRIDEYIRGIFSRRLNKCLLEYSGLEYHRIFYFATRSLQRSRNFSKFTYG